MAPTGGIEKLSVIEFEDKHIIGNPISGKSEPDGEEIRCIIPGLNIGERVILNSWGDWEVHHYKDHRRRLGIYVVVSKKDGGEPHYVLRESEIFSESGLVHALLSGNFAGITAITKGLRYIVTELTE